VAAAYLFDTNILLRLIRRGDSSHALIQQAVRELLNQNVSLYYCSQNIVELWNVLTRPLERNGFGLSIVETETEVRLLERDFTILPDNDRIHHIWRRLVSDYSVRGRQVHDARLVAAMCSYGLTQLLTLNRADFLRYREITAFQPAEISTPA
jgi:predicted nucleic acid-binding protein